MSEKQLSEEKIKARMSTISLPGINNLRKCYNTLMIYIRNNEFSQEDFTAKVHTEFSAYTFNSVEHLAELAENFLTTYVDDPDFGIQVLDLLSEFLDNFEPFMKRSVAITLVTQETVGDC